MLKTRLKRFLLAGAFGLVAAAAAGCAATTGGAGDRDAHNRDVLVCRDTAPTGSHIARATCYKRSQIEERGENDREKVRRLQHGGAVKPKNFK